MINAIKETWKTLTDTLTVMSRYRTDSRYPLLAYLILLLVTFGLLIPLFATLLGLTPKDLLTWVIFFLVVYLAYGLLHLVMTFGNVMLIISIARRLDNHAPASPPALLQQTWQRGQLIVRYSVVAATLNLVSFLARVLINPLFGGVIAPLIGDKLWVRWRQLSYKIPMQLAIPIIALDPPTTETPFQRSERMVKESWGERVKPAHSISLLALLLLLPILVLLAIPTIQQGVGAGDRDGIERGLCFFLMALLTYTQLSALVNAIFALAAYRYATVGQSDLFPGDPSYAQQAFVKPQAEPGQEATLTSALIDTLSTSADDPPN